MRILLNLLMASVLITGCQASPEISEVSEEPSEVVAFAGMITVFEGDDPTAEVEILTKTSSYRDANRAVEESIHIDQEDLDNPEFYTTNVAIDGDKMVIKEINGKYQGVGEFLEGQAWERTKWKTTVVTEDDLDMESEMTVDGDNLTIVQTLSEGGDEIFNMKGTLKKITNEEFDRRKDELTP